jgi:phosphopantetheine--protein transferase-like protein
MKILTGVDVVDIERFEKGIKEDGEKLLSRLFLPSERSRSSNEHLAGLFAAKEAVAKAFSITREAWLQIEIQADESGKPRFELAIEVPYEILSCDLSVAHDAGIAIAQCVALIS